MGEQQTQPMMTAANGNGRRVTWPMLAMLAAVALTVAGATLWAADRFGAVEGRVGVLETHYQHISESLKGIHQKLDRAK